jgi:hypothetical protein
MRNRGEYKDAYEFFMYIDDDKNAACPILFKDFEYRSSAMNKSFLVKLEDIAAASLERKANSISMIEAIKLRWKICLPMDGVWDIKRGKTPLRSFVTEMGLELYLDPEEVVEIRDEARIVIESKKH